jgi:hypothetical protein
MVGDRISRGWHEGLPRARPHAIVVIVYGLIGVWIMAVVWFISQEPPPGESSLPDVVAAFSAAVRDGDAATLERLLADPPDTSQFARDLLDHLREVGLTDLRVSVRDDGDKQLLEVTGRRPDGSTAISSYRLTQQDGRWRVEIGPHPLG